MAPGAIVADEHELAAVRGRLLGLVEEERILRVGIPRPDPGSVVPNGYQTGTSARARAGTRAQR